MKSSAVNFTFLFILSDRNYYTKTFVDLLTDQRKVGNTDFTLVS